MARLALTLALATAAAIASLAGPAVAKTSELRAGTAVICGLQGCAPFDDADGLAWLNGLMFAESPTPGPTPRLAPYYELRYGLADVGGQPSPLGWLVPEQGAARLYSFVGAGWRSQWYPLSPVAADAVVAATRGREPFSPPDGIRVEIAGVEIADVLASESDPYLALLGPLPETFRPPTGARGVPIALPDVPPTPWTVGLGAQLSYVPQERALRIAGRWFDVPASLAEQIELDAGLRPPASESPPWSRLAVAGAAGGLVLAAALSTVRRRRGSQRPTWQLDASERARVSERGLTPGVRPPTGVRRTVSDDARIADDSGAGANRSVARSRSRSGRVLERYGSRGEGVVRSLLVVLVVAGLLAVAGPAAAKGPLGASVCGSEACVPLDGAEVERLLEAALFGESSGPGGPPPLQPFYELRFSGFGPPAESWVVPGAGVGRWAGFGTSRPGWRSFSAELHKALVGAVAELEPFPVPVLAAVEIDGTSVVDPAPYGAIYDDFPAAPSTLRDLEDRVYVDLRARRPNPWTAPGSEVYYLPADGVLYRDGQRVRPPAQLADRIEVAAGLRPASASGSRWGSVAAALAVAGLSLAAVLATVRRRRASPGPATPRAG